MTVVMTRNEAKHEHAAPDHQGRQPVVDACQHERCQREGADRANEQVAAILDASQVVQIAQVETELADGRNQEGFEKSLRA